MWTSFVRGITGVCGFAACIAAVALTQTCGAQSPPNPVPFPAPVVLPPDQQKTLNLTVRVKDPAGNPIANVPVQYTTTLHKDHPVFFWGAVTSESGEATASFGAAKAMTSIGVSLGTFARMNAAGNDRAARERAQFRAIAELDQLRTMYAFKREYRVPLTPEQTTAEVVIQAEEAIKVIGRVRVGSSLATDVAVGCEGQDGVVFSKRDSMGEVPFTLRGVPKGRPFTLIVVTLTISKFINVPAQTADFDIGLIDLLPLESSREVAVRATYSPSFPELQKDSVLCFFRADGMATFDVTVARQMFPGGVPEGTDPEHFVGGATFDFLAPKARLPAGTYVVTGMPVDRDGERRRAILRKLRAGADPASLGLYTVTVPAEGPFELVIPPEEVQAKEFDFWPQSWPVTP
ncbi:MAG: Ig-like domain-containing protein [Phycisphaerales bacterium]|nr:Ig-like domain-containing protein [Phycisphaerales bacterium]